MIISQLCTISQKVSYNFGILRIIRLPSGTFELKICADCSLDITCMLNVQLMQLSLTGSIDLMTNHQTLAAVIFANDGKFNICTTCRFILSYFVLFESDDIVSEKK